MNKLSQEKRSMILGCLREGMGLRASARIARVSKNTVAKLLEDVGRAAMAYQNENIVDHKCERSKSMRFGLSLEQSNATSSAALKVTATSTPQRQSTRNLSY